MSIKFFDCTDLLAKKFARFRDSMRAVVQDRPEYLLVCDEAVKVYGDTGVLVETSDRSFKIGFDKADKFLFFYAWFGPCQDMMIAYRNSEYKQYQYPSLSELYKRPDVIERFQQMRFDESFVLLTSMIRHMPEGTFGQARPTSGDLDFSNDVVILDVNEGEIVREHFQSDVVVNSVFASSEGEVYPEGEVNCAVKTFSHHAPVMIELETKEEYKNQPEESGVVPWLGSGWEIEPYHAQSTMSNVTCGCYKHGISGTGRDFSCFIDLVAKYFSGICVSAYFAGSPIYTNSLVKAVRGAEAWFKELDRRLHVAKDKQCFTKDRWGDMLVADAAEIVMATKKCQCSNANLKILSTGNKQVLWFGSDSVLKAWVFKGSSCGVKVVMTDKAWKLAWSLFDQIPIVGFQRDWTDEFRKFALSNLSVAWDYGTPLWDMDSLAGYHYVGDLIETDASRGREVIVVNCVNEMPKEGVNTVVTTMNYCKLPFRCLAIYLTVGFAEVNDNILESVIQSRLANVSLFPKSIVSLKFRKGKAMAKVVLDVYEDNYYYKRVRANLDFYISFFLVSGMVNPVGGIPFWGKWAYGDDYRDMHLREKDVDVIWEADDRVSEIEFDT